MNKIDELIKSLQLGEDVTILGTAYKVVEIKIEGSAKGEKTLSLKLYDKESQIESTYEMHRKSFGFF